MTNAEVVFAELERQGLHGATLVLYNDKVFIEGPVEIDCDALVKAIKKRPSTLPCPPDRGVDVALSYQIDVPDSLSVTPAIPWSMQTIAQLEAEKAYWDQIIEGADSWIVSTPAFRFSHSCNLWIEKRRAELSQMAQIDNRFIVAN